MDAWTLMGFVAGSLTTSGYIPQIIKGYRTKRMHDVSLMMVSILCVGMSLWIVYGISQDDLALIVSNIIGTTFLSVLIAMKFIYNGRDRVKE